MLGIVTHLKEKQNFCQRLHSDNKLLRCRIPITYIDNIWFLYASRNLQKLFRIMNQHLFPFLCQTAEDPEIPRHIPASPGRGLSSLLQNTAANGQRYKTLDNVSASGQVKINEYDWLKGCDGDLILSLKPPHLLINNRGGGKMSSPFKRQAYLTSLMFKQH